MRLHGSGGGGGCSGSIIAGCSTTVADVPTILTSMPSSARTAWTAVAVMFATITAISWVSAGGGTPS